jgi:hypothetical protein
LIHFAILAGAIFGFHTAVLSNEDSEQKERIVVTQGRIVQMVGMFEKMWRRTPTPSELKGLIDDYVREEIYYREALFLGLDKDDAVIRRRLRLKMEFLSEAQADVLTPTDAALQEYLTVHPDNFQIDPRFTFSQIYLNPQLRGSKVEDDAGLMLEALRSKATLDPLVLGDPTSLPHTINLQSEAAIGQTFGPEFAKAVASAKTGIWTGTITSTFGQHLIRVNEVEPGRTLDLNEVRSAVAREWASEQRRKFTDQRLAEILKRYEIVIETRETMPTQAASN